MKIRIQFGRVVALLLCVIFLFPLLVLVHELGHVFATLWFGNSIDTITILGVEFYPHSLMAIYVGMGDYFGYVSYGGKVVLSRFDNGVVGMAGSGATLLLGVIAFGLLGVRKKFSFCIITLLFIISFSYLDMVSYTFGIRPGLRFGKAHEPLEAALQLGIPKTVWLVAMVIVFAVCTGFVVRYMKRTKYFQNFYETSRH